MSLLDCYLPVFKQMLKMIGAPAQFVDYEQNRHDCLSLLDLAISAAGKQDISKEEKESARMAVIAWLDETVLCSELPWRHRWQNESLQRKYLNITIAGERFFTLMSQLEPVHKQAHEVFLFCLQYGFHGQYISPEEQPSLEALIRQQRSLCLPDAWQTWPNEASIVPDLPARMPTSSVVQRLSSLLAWVFGVAAIYAAIYFFLNYYIR